MVDSDPGLWAKDEVIKTAPKDLIVTLKKCDRAFEQSPNNEPAMRCRLDAIIIFTYCEMADHGMRYGASQNMFLQFEKKLESIVTFHGKRRTLTGIADYTLWYRDAAKASSNLIVMEAKRYGETSGLAQLVSYMGIIHKARIEEKKENDMVYGVLTDSYAYIFVCMRNNGRYSTHSYCWKGGEQARDTIVSLLARVMREAALVSPKTSDIPMEG